MENTLALTYQRIRVIEWMLGLLEPKYATTMHSACLKATKDGVLKDVGNDYELTPEWLHRYVFSNSKFSKVPATLRQLGGSLDKPTNPTTGQGWKFPTEQHAENAVAYLGSWGIKADRSGTLIKSLDY